MTKIQSPKRGTNFKFQISAKGFTLVELLVVIAIIGILSSLMVANYIGIQSRGRDAQRKSDIRQIQSGFELYRSESGAYPASMPACGAALSFSGTTYIRKMPCDPINTNPLVYRYQSAFSNSAYTLAVCLENINDKQKDATNNPPRVDGGASITGCNGTANWSYTLFSP